MKILILGGFLGSGKTTVLLQLVHYIAGNSQKTQKTNIAIIENEIGQSGVDDKILRKAGYEVKDILSGCVCCTLTTDLITGIQEIQNEIDPEWLIIEATGVAFPGSIAQSLYRNLGVAARIVVIVDASRWQRLHIPLEYLIHGQLNGAHTVLINKVDLVDEEEFKAVEKEVGEINAQAALYRADGTKEIATDILKGILYGQPSNHT